MDDSFRGRVAVCGHGHLGVVEGNDGRKFHGYHLISNKAAKVLWQSKSPRFLSEKESERLRRRLGDLE